MLLLGVDIETGGEFSLPPEQNFITEIAAVLWDTDFNQPVEVFSALVKCDRPVSAEAAEYSGITQELLDRHGKLLDYRLIKPFTELMKEADFVVAHNGRDFDRPILAAALKECNQKLPDKEWIDTLYDIDFPRNCTSRNLTYLAGFHGLLNSFPHRAVTDVLTMLTILSRYDLEKVIENCRAKWIVVQANVSFDEKDKAKAKGFRWQNEAGRTYEKAWVKKIRENQFPALQKEWDFGVTIIERL